MIILLIILTLLAADPAPPITDLRATQEGDHVVLTWTQRSDADQVCVHITDEHGIYTYADCKGSAAGAHREELPAGAMYNVVEWQTAAEVPTIYGDYWAPLTPLFRLYLPVASSRWTLTTCGRRYGLAVRPVQPSPPPASAA